MNIKSVDINNFPLLGELMSEDINWSQKNKQICYVGGITHIRGILEVIQAMENVKSGARLQLVGEFSEKNIKNKIHPLADWQCIDELGFLNRQEVAKVLQKSVAGLVTFLPVPNHIDAQPNKMFEYMSAGIPVISSNFPLWKKIIEGNSCGICIDPLNPKAIAEAIDYLITNPQIAEKMGRNGKKAAEDKYNWNIEEAKLLKVYSSLLMGRIK